MAVAIFLLFVGMVLGLSFYFANKTRSASGYYAAGGQIHWGVNGIAFAGDYLSAASFLGICGMIATSGYDGFLYSIGYLAGWIVALFVVAEPMKRMGKYTFTDAVDAKFNSRGIKLMAAISTLVVSLCYLIPQMVGAGVLVEPLLGMPHAVGVILVGAVVIIIVATAGMTSTTYVQFLKGALLIVFSLVVTVAVLMRGLSTAPDQGGQVPFEPNVRLAAHAAAGGLTPADPAYAVVETHAIKAWTFYKLSRDGRISWWIDASQGGQAMLEECQWESRRAGAEPVVNGEPGGRLRQVGNLVSIEGRSGPEARTGPTNPFRFLSAIGSPDTQVLQWRMTRIKDAEGADVTLHHTYTTPGNKILRPGTRFKIEGSLLERIDFVSLMLALFLGTAALPHILIRYYTVPSPAAARKSTIVAIAAIGFFYILTLYMGLGAMVNAVINPLDNNMSAPLLARSFGTFLFAVITAIAFATVLGTVAGLIVAASGAVAHDLMDRFAGVQMNEKQKVRAGRLAAFAVGLVAIVLGILFKGQNVSFLVGLAFAVAASANLPAVIMLLFWRRTTAKGVAASIAVGVVSSLALIAFSPSLFSQYGLDPATAPIPFDNPGIFSIPLSFLVLVAVSLATRPKASPGVA
ncbi:MAG TPA: cation acetate symporter [Acidobacteriota bacterium]|nr:cation acetate symporter [Acidobacteriota bacterium]HNR38977.1 cation acetate symporter [Acidobacteriota bacterium]HNU00902.1 cation acetate symporter [Acidobacteriota bacterium]HPB28676.1 cation acetate symporter [Acidobacteriota bacterium]HQO24636.1 cation acetate symporter [Acidobacteriota bacterium]